jgi:hypothetical protein
MYIEKYVQVRLSEPLKRSLTCWDTWVGPAHGIRVLRAQVWELTDSEVRTRATIGRCRDDLMALTCNCNAGVKTLAASSCVPCTLFLLTIPFCPFVSLLCPSHNPCMGQLLFRGECTMQLFDLRTLPQTASAVGMMASPLETIRVIFPYKKSVLRNICTSPPFFSFSNLLFLNSYISLNLFVALTSSWSWLRYDTV